MRSGGRARTFGAVSLWGRVFAAMYDPMMAGSEKAGLAEQRAKLLERARGRVLEIGGGTGANLPHYVAAVEELVVAEPEEPMARRLERKVREQSRPVQVVRAPAEQLPFEDGSFDTVVSTLVLCTVDDPRRALAEIHRVLKPAGELLFLEHVRADDPKLARWQDRLNGINTRLARGCNCNRPTLETVERAGFAVSDVTHGQFPKAPPIARPLVAGAAARVL